MMSSYFEDPTLTVMDISVENLSLHLTVNKRGELRHVCAFPLLSFTKDTKTLKLFLFLSDALNDLDYFFLG